MLTLHRKLQRCQQFSAHTHPIVSMRQMQKQRWGRRFSFWRCTKRRSIVQTSPLVPQAHRVRRPTVVGGGSSEDWNYFETRWDEYSAATKLSGSDKVLQLLECCDEQLRRDLTRAAGETLSAKSETDVLQAIRKLAVREENTMVARFTLNQMVQETDEPVRNFGARIKGQANVCGYNIE